MYRKKKSHDRVMSIHNTDLEYTFINKDNGYVAETAQISRKLGAEKLGYRLVKLNPGCKAWPFHNHFVNEEMFFVVSGIGIVRLGNEVINIQAGDIIAALSGDRSEAHQIINNSDECLVYICVSTMLEPDIVEYPDSDKFGIFAGAAPGGNKDQRTFNYIGRKTSKVGYWDDE